MYEVMVEDTFSAAHQLIGYDGKCEKLHGHNWRVQLSVRSTTLNKLGFVIDFTELKQVLQTVLNEFDHCYLNQMAHFKNRNPTAENIAEIILGELAGPFGDKACWVHQVRVYESERSSASVFGEQSG